MKVHVLIVQKALTITLIGVVNITPLSARIYFDEVNNTFESTSYEKGVICNNVGDCFKVKLLSSYCESIENTSFYSKKDIEQERKNYMIGFGLGILVPMDVSNGNQKRKGLSFVQSIQFSTYLNEIRSLSLTVGVNFGLGHVDFNKDSELDYFSIALVQKINYHWFEGAGYSLYSGAGLGVFGKEQPIAGVSLAENRTLHLAFQFDALGLQFNWAEHRMFFTELGFGNEGLLKGGIRYKW